MNWRTTCLTAQAAWPRAAYSWTFTVTTAVTLPISACIVSSIWRNRRGASSHATRGWRSKRPRHLVKVELARLPPAPIAVLNSLAYHLLAVLLCKQCDLLRNGYARSLSLTLSLTSGDRISTYATPGSPAMGPGQKAAQDRLEEKDNNPHPTVRRRRAR